MEQTLCQTSKHLMVIPGAPPSSMGTAVFFIFQKCLILTKKRNLDHLWILAPSQVGQGGLDCEMINRMYSAREPPKKYLVGQYAGD